MASFRLDEIAEKTNGRIIHGDAGLIVKDFDIDSRQIAPGGLFFAVVAKRDGHDYIMDARRAGAAAAVVSRDVQPPDPGFGIIRVENTVTALRELAKKLLSRNPVKVVGITGSAGKTTTKEFVASLLGGRYRVLKSEKNLNNYLGLALSVLRLSPQDDVAVLEMAMSAAGELRDLTKIAPPDIAVITNVNPVHLEFFQSLEAIAEAKKEILDGTKPGGLAVLNADDPLVRKVSAGFVGRKILFGLSPESEVRAAAVRKRGLDGMSFELWMAHEHALMRFPFFSEGYLYNLLAAAGVAYALGLGPADLAEPVSRLKPLPGRGALVKLRSGIKLIDDTYNSNPKALESALKSLVGLPAKRRVAVVGDMLELGKDEADYHLQAGSQAARAGWDLLVTVGPRGIHVADGAAKAGMEKNRIVSFGDSAEAAEGIIPLLRENDLILVKGSRGMRTEKITEKIIRQIGEA